MKSLRTHVGITSFLLGAAAIACGSSSDDSSLFDAGGGGDKNDATVQMDGSGLSTGDDGGGITITNPADAGPFDASTFVLTPATTTLTVADGTTPQPITFVASDNGVPVSASFRIADRNELATIDVKSGAFNVTGNLAGTVTVAADYDNATATATVTIQRTSSENGDPTALVPGSVDAGADSGGSATYFGSGGYGGVGGDGPGGAVTSGQQGTLDNPSATSDGSSWLYPYDKTVFPREMLPPLLQWAPGSAGDYDAVKVKLTEADFTWTGYFAKPALATTFQNIPIPNDAWTRLYSSYSNATKGDDVQVSVTLLAKGGATAYSLPTRTWHIAGGALRGTIYYQSYGTHLATQGIGDYNGKNFGGATLAIQPGASAPSIVAGYTSGDLSGCRVCHSVSSGGTTLVTELGTDYDTSAVYDLTASNIDGGFPADAGGATHNDVFPGLSADGTVLMSNYAGIEKVNTAVSSQFFTTAGGASIPMAGLPTTLKALFPTFSPDSTQVAYADQDTGSLTVAQIDLTGKTFGATTSLYKPNTGTPYWPSFTPTNDGVVFEVELQSNGRDIGGTRSKCDDKNDANNCSDQGTHAELWYANTKNGMVHRLDSANGDGYLPTHASAFHVTYPDGGVVDDRNDDPQFNYEPTVNPVVSGGYAWIVFTSRREYGNVANINPFHSDPRFTDISKTPTTKKLWVAAIDLSADGSSDASYPAFYLPGQELLAGNARGYWVVEPCAQNGSSCMTGDQCCGGYCQPDGDGGALICSNVKPACAQELEKCTTSADCCGTTLTCINDRCATPSMPGPR